jgi:hypothetical protein
MGLLLGGVKDKELNTTKRKLKISSGKSDVNYISHITSALSIENCFDLKMLTTKGSDTSFVKLIEHHLL